MSLPSPSTASRSSTTTTLTALSIDKGDDDGPPWDAPDKPAAVAAAAWQAPFGIMSWIFLSNLTILLNKWLIDTAGFRYPILLACWHFIFTSVTIHILARTTTLLDSRHSLHITPRIYARTIIPIGVCFSLSLICSNVVYLYLSVAFIQMLNAANPVAVLAVSWIWGVADPSTSTLLNMLLIVAGAAIASFGEIQFSTIGFVFQAGGIIFGAIRLVMIQVLVSRKGMRMDPLVGLYYFGPACAIMTLAAALFIEVPRFRMSHLIDAGVGMLVLNAAVAFLLNVTTVYLVRNGRLYLLPRAPLANLVRTGRKNVWPRHGTDGHLQEHSAHRSICCHMEHQDNAPPGRGLQPRPRWPNIPLDRGRSARKGLQGGNKGYFECLIRLASVRGECTTTCRRCFWVRVLPGHTGDCI
ncbi:hypothetical protein PLICBS_000200 [Purpureocillium lilacinum]|uniref:uncharacterized protein n=1 Tax=Purpureocillium lilacinum TaxID=33203 RepID=UPI00208C5C23|nr:hypothetical protein PLICBS_000200 [Purpureocillium lilacinum]